MQMARKPRKYYTLVALVDGRWGIQFGAYERGDVVAERAAYIENGEAKARELKIITTGDKVEEINAAVAKLNGEGA
ncbi:hypothetical protein RHEph01_gp005 [Rhizobium phage RHEph01]|uniref:Uncharacterized protein n=1 Tax=Rhizobium phage RHEph01 TaxID=1220601 RepID=L7TQW1_9CAUD|nr:hypothetical protein HOQ88_gp05 [Rhizobium phage RHEph01]AGC35516.1 hypothetical protein RHEph01_gp005 [Rhizobium phage RHEph01]